MLLLRVGYGAAQFTRTSRRVASLAHIRLRPNIPSPKRPVYAITQKLVSRPVEFCPAVCHATNGDLSHDARGRSYWEPVFLRGEEKALAASSLEANRNDDPTRIGIPSDQREPRDSE
jgi:hypothetical protein